jgi:mannitol/fructose-specific phosphotransferase system IIA component (Ntr-type)
MAAPIWSIKSFLESDGVPMASLFDKGERAQLIFLIGVPQRLVNDYLICLGTLARVLKDDAVREALMGAQTAA